MNDFSEVTAESDEQSCYQSGGSLQLFDLGTIPNEIKKKDNLEVSLFECSIFYHQITSTIYQYYFCSLYNLS